MAVKNAGAGMAPSCAPFVRANDTTGRGEMSTQISILGRNGKKKLIILLKAIEI